MRPALVLVACLGSLGACADDSESPLLPPDGADAGSFSIRVTNVGVECSAENSCQGAASTCMLVSSTNTQYPAGYCTATCESSVQCGPGAVCPVGESLAQDPNFAVKEIWPKICFRRCDANAPVSGCRTGYVCRSLAAAYLLSPGNTPPAMHEPVCIPIPRLPQRS